MASLIAVADPNEEPRGGIIMEEAMEVYNATIALHPEWVIPGLGWGPVISNESDEEGKKCQQQ